MLSYTVLILGSSLANKLKKFDKIKIHYIAGIRFRLIYRGFSGESYEHLLNRPVDIERALRCRPDAVLTIIGGNSIKTTVAKKVILDNCRDFHALVHRELQLVNPKALLLASQVPLRFNYNPKNKFKCPPPVEFKVARDYINKKLKTVHCIDQLLLIAGPGRLDNPDLFYDGTHFSDEGLQIQLDLILVKLEKIFRSR